MSSFKSITVAFEQLRDSGDETTITRSEANIMLLSILTYTFLAYLNFWNPVLKEINDSQIFLQTRGLGSDYCETKVRALENFCFEQRENIVESAKIKATSFCQGNGIPTERRVRRRKKMMGKIQMKLVCHCNIREQLQIMDTLHGEIKRRTSHMIDVNAKF